MRLRPRARPTSRRSARRCAPGPIAARACRNSRGSCMNTRTPSEARPPRMEVLARLPVFYALAGKRAVVAGGSAAAAWKAELLIAAGAAVDVYAAEVSEELTELAANTPLITIHPRAIDVGDFVQVTMAIGAFEDDAQAAAFAALARCAGVPVNVIDKPAFCDFSFGAIVNRSPLVIGISTDGAAPVFGQAIRAKLEALIPRGFARWAEAARTWRPRVQALALSFRERRRFWERFTERAVAEPQRAPTSSDLDTLMSETRGASGDVGSVILVGAGPGDPELLTLRAVRALQCADVILIDDLVSPQVLDFDWRALADPAATTIVYMPKKTLRELSERATAEGLNATTPAVAVANATRPEETIVAGTIADIADRIEAVAPDGPLLVMIGKVLAEVVEVQTLATAPSPLVGEAISDLSTRAAG